MTIRNNRSGVSAERAERVPLKRTASEAIATHDAASLSARSKRVASLRTSLQTRMFCADTRTPSPLLRV